MADGVCDFPEPHDPHWDCAGRPWPEVRTVMQLPSVLLKVTSWKKLREFSQVQGMPLGQVIAQVIEERFS